MDEALTNFSTIITAPLDRVGQRSYGQLIIQQVRSSSWRVSLRQTHRSIRKSHDLSIFDRLCAAYVLADCTGLATLGSLLSGAVKTGESRKEENITMENCILTVNLALSNILL